MRSNELNSAERGKGRRCRLEGKFVNTLPDGETELKINELLLCFCQMIHFNSICHVACVGEERPRLVKIMLYFFNLSSAVRTNQSVTNCRDLLRQLNSGECST